MTTVDWKASVREIAWLFLRLGATSFGGPAAHIALMEREVVQRRGWLTHEQFLDMLGATNLIPGPNSTEMAIHIGWSRARWAGLLVAGACFIAPSALITLVLAWVYVRCGTRPEASGMLYGIKPVVIAILVQALGRLGRSALKTRALVITAALAYVWGGRDLRAVAPRSDSANFPGFFSILCSVFRDSVVTIFRVIS